MSTISMPSIGPWSLRARARTRVAHIGLCCALLLARPSASSAQTINSDALIWTGAGVVLLGAFIADREVREAAVEHHGSLAPLSRLGNRLGRPEFSLPVMGVAYGLGHLSGKPRLADGALHAAEALAAAGVVNGLLKFGLGRGRPDHVGYDSDELRPLSLADHWQSFPSGHTVVAFSLAASLSEETGNPWVSGLAYGSAAMVGWSRVYDNRHWTSDVVAGAILGMVVSRSTIRWLHRRGDSRVSSPNLILTPRGLSVRIPFP